MKKALIIGGGFAGCAAAHQLENIGGWNTTIVEAAPFLGAGVKTNFYGGHPYTFGPRHFLTQKEHLFEYLNNIIPMRLCSEHEFLTYVEPDQSFYAYPINMQDVKTMPDFNIINEEMKKQNKNKISEAKNLEEYWIASVGKTLFKKMIDKYNKKMWLVEDCKDIDTFNWSPKGVALKDGPRAAWDSAISAYPIDIEGYNKYFPFATKDAEILLSTKIEDYDIENKRVKIKGESYKFDLIINTISPDILFNQCYGELPYIGRIFHKIVIPTEHIFPENVFFLYYANEEQFTRIVEYKKFTKYKSNSSLLGLEIPSLNAGKHYPLPFKSEILKAKKYLDLMPKNSYSIGRAGTYTYAVDIDDCINQALIMSEIIKAGGTNNPVPGEEYQINF